MAQADWITYGTPGGAKASEITRLRDLFANVGEFQKTASMYQGEGGGAQINWANNPQLQALLSQNGLSSSIGSFLGGTHNPHVQQSFDESGMWYGIGNDQGGLDRITLEQLAQQSQLSNPTLSLAAQVDPERAGKKGNYNLVFNPDGTIQDVTWKNAELSDGWMAENGWMIPVAAAAAGATGLIGPGAGVGGAGAAPIAQSAPSWVAPGAGASSVPAGLGSGTFGLGASEAAALPFGSLTGAPALTGGGLTPAITAGSAAPALAEAAPISSSAITSLGPAATRADVAAFTGARGLSSLASGAKDVLGHPSNLAALINAYSQNRQGRAQEDWASRLYDDRKQFLDRLAQTYEDPSVYLGGEEYNRMADIELDRLMRRDAAQGRLATDVERQKLMQDYALSNLENYRKGLSGAAGLTGVSGIPELGVSGLANQYGTANAILSQMSRANGGQGFNVVDFLSNVFDLGDIFG